MLRTCRGLVLACLALISSACAEPPLKEMNQAQGGIDTARAAGAEQYAREQFAAAVDALRRSEEAAAAKDYRLALSLAIEGREQAQAAARLAADARAKARGDAEREVTEATMALGQTQKQLADQAAARLPRGALAMPRQRLAAAEKAMQEARAALAQEDYPRAVDLSRRVSEGIREAASALDKAATAPAARRRR
jgi:hypothetical protein